MTPDEWFNNRKGQSLLVPGQDPSLSGQCVQAADYALKEIYGLPYHYGNAADWWYTPGDLLEHFDKCPFPANFPKKGDFVIWSTSLPGSDGYGHIDLAMTDGDMNGFTGADSNWGGKTLHLVQHDNKYVLGMLRPKGGETMTPDELNLLAQVAWNRQVNGSDPFVTDYNGLPVEKALQDVLNSDENKAIRTKAANFDNIAKALAAAYDQIDKLKASPDAAKLAQVVSDLQAEVNKYKS